MNKKCRQIVACVLFSVVNMTAIAPYAQCVIDPDDPDHQPKVSAPSAPSTPSPQYLFGIEENVVASVVIVGAFFLSFLFASNSKSPSTFSD